MVSIWLTISFTQDNQTCRMHKRGWSTFEFSINRKGRTWEALHQCFCPSPSFGDFSWPFSPAPALATCCHLASRRATWSTSTAGPAVVSSTLPTTIWAMIPATLFPRRRIRSLKRPSSWRRGLGQRRQNLVKRGKETMWSCVPMASTTADTPLTTHTSILIISTNHTSNIWSFSEGQSSLPSPPTDCSCHCWSQRCQGLSGSGQDVPPCKKVKILLDMTIENLNPNASEWC